MDSISEHFLAHVILCFTETQLDAKILSDVIILGDTFDVPYRKDRTNHGWDY